MLKMIYVYVQVCNKDFKKRMRRYEETKLKRNKVN